MTNHLNQWESDEEFHSIACAKHGINVTEDNEERFCYSVSHMVVDREAGEADARRTAFKNIYGVEV